MDGNEVALLHQKVDRLTEMVEAQYRRQLQIEELAQEVFPIANHAVKLTIDELDEIGGDFQLEDLLYLLKRLLRDTRMLIKLLDRLEAVSQLGDEVELLGKQVFNNVVEALDRLEREGYFTFAQGGWRIIQKIVNEFTEEDVNALGDNIVTILKTVRNMTQPEIMALANNAIDAIRQDDSAGENISLWHLIREMGDPQVRRGLARTLNIVKALADQPDSSVKD
jgi:uncharacterized protein YjgD (DUF1641 family)